MRDSTKPLVLQETYAGCASNKNTPLPTVTSVVVTYDNTPLPTITPVAPPSPSTLTLKVGGVSSRSLPSEWTVMFDDVVANVK